MEWAFFADDEEPKRFYPNLSYVYIKFGSEYIELQHVENLTFQIPEFNDLYSEVIKLTNLTDQLGEILAEETYERQNKGEVQDAIKRLGVTVSETFFEFYDKYTGPFWEESVPFELLDIVEDTPTIESYTMITRKEHGFPQQYLVVSEMSANAVLVLDTNTDRVYKVNFEGEDELLKKGELKETWSTFPHNQKK